MPTAPAKPCRDPYCQNLRPCPLHARKPYESRTPRRRYGSSGWAWQRTVAAVIDAAGGRCQLRLDGCTVRATTADHVLSPRHGGSDEAWNLRASCGECNETRRREQAKAGRA